MMFLCLFLVGKCVQIRISYLDVNQSPIVEQSSWGELLLQNTSGDKRCDNSLTIVLQYSQTFNQIEQKCKTTNPICMRVRNLNAYLNNVAVLFISYKMSKNAKKRAEEPKGSYISRHQKYKWHIIGGGPCYNFALGPKSFQLQLCSVVYSFP